MSGERPVCRPTELPLYSQFDAPKPKEPDRTPGRIENFIRTCRQNVFFVLGQLRELSQQASIAAESINKKTTDTITFLQQPDSVNERYGAVFIAGLTGLVYARRKSRIKQLMYAGIPASAMAAIIYPNEFATFCVEAKTKAQELYGIAYLFIYGVSDQPPPSLPTIPTNFSEAWGVASSFGKSIKSLVPVEYEPLGGAGEKKLEDGKPEEVVKDEAKP